MCGCIGKLHLVFKMNLIITIIKSFPIQCEVKFDDQIVGMKNNECKAIAAHWMMVLSFFLRSCCSNIKYSTHKQMKVRNFFQQKWSNTYWISQCFEVAGERKKRLMCSKIVSLWNLKYSSVGTYDTVIWCCIVCRKSVCSLYLELFSLH